MGIIISAVAALLISWLNTTVTTKRAASNMIGPFPAVAPTMALATSSLAPEVRMAWDSGIMPAISSTVVHSIRRYACLTVRTPDTIIAPAASKAATTAGTAPVASSSTITASTESARLDPRPSGTA